MDFVNDYLNFCKLRLEEAGYKLTNNEDGKIFAMEYNWGNLGGSNEV